MHTIYAVFIPLSSAFVYILLGRILNGVAKQTRSEEFASRLTSGCVLVVFVIFMVAILLYANHPPLISTPVYASMIVLGSPVIFALLLMVRRISDASDALVKKLVERELARRIKRGNSAS